MGGDRLGFSQSPEVNDSPIIPTQGTPIKMQILVAELVEVLGACPERIGSSTALPPAS